MVLPVPPTCPRCQVRQRPPLAPWALALIWAGSPRRSMGEGIHNLLKGDGFNTDPTLCLFI